MTNQKKLDVQSFLNRTSSKLGTPSLGDIPNKKEDELSKEEALRLLKEFGVALELSMTGEEIDYRPFSSEDMNPEYLPSAAKFRVANPDSLRYICSRQLEGILFLQTQITLRASEWQDKIETPYDLRALGEENHEEMVLFYELTTKREELISSLLELFDLAEDILAEAGLCAVPKDSA